MPFWSYDISPDDLSCLPMTPFDFDIGWGVAKQAMDSLEACSDAGVSDQVQGAPHLE